MTRAVRGAKIMSGVANGNHHSRRAVLGAEMSGEANGKHHSRSRAAGPIAGAATRGLFWSAAAGASSKVVAVASTFVLARLLDREAFGVAAYALTVTTLLEVLRGMGIGQALIYYPRDQRRTETAFWLIVANGVALGLISILVAPLMGLFYRDARAPGVIRMLALYFPLLSLGQVIDVELRKDLRFGRRFGPELSRALAKAGVAVALAAAGAGYWSLVTAQIAGAAAWSAVLLAIAPWRPRFAFDREEAKHLLGYGKHMVAVALLAAVALRADHLVVGRFLGPAPLGVYTIAFTMPAFLFQASGGLSQVLFPAYALLERDRDRLRSAALRTLRLAGAVFVPAGVGLGLVAEPFIAVAFGSKWGEAATLLPWMGAWAALTAVTQHFGEVYKALGYARLLSWLSAVTTVLLVPALVWVGVRGGSLVQIVAALIAVRAVRTVLDFVAIRRLVDLRLGAALLSMTPALASTLLMAGAVIALRGVSEAWPESARLALLTVAGAAVYVGALTALDRGLVGEIRDLLRAAIGRRLPRLS
jgi:PST family polysaccharide transporter